MELKEYYQKERVRIGALASRYYKKHPGLEPLMADPAIERLFEGTAFLCALLQMKLDDDLPEIIHDVMRSVRPEQLRPIPACTVIAFTPKPNCTATHFIPKGTEVASVPVDGTSCRFTTVYPVEMHPLSLVDASFSQPPGKAPEISLWMELRGMPLADWKPQTVRLFLSGEYCRAADLYLLLTRHLKRIIIVPDADGTAAVLSCSNLTPVGFETGEELFPSSSPGFGHDGIREFALFPEKYLFLDLSGWHEWRERGDGARFEVRFELDRLPFPLKEVTADDFMLFASPAVNVFPHKAKPILYTGEDADYPIIPEGDNPGHYAVYTVERVSGVAEGLVKTIIFSPRSGSSAGSQQCTSYREILNESLLGEGYETAISLNVSPDSSPQHIKSLSAELLCTNGRLTETLRIGDICQHTQTSLNFVTFTNCTPVTRTNFARIGDNRLWRLFGMQFVNLKLLTAGSLSAALKLYSVSYGQDSQAVVRNERHIEGIRGLAIESGDRVIKQTMKRGWNVRLELDPDCFCSPGDMYLFGATIDHFLREFVSEAYFSRTIMENACCGVEYEFPAMMGRRVLV